MHLDDPDLISNFEQEWKRGASPSLEAVLARCGSQQQADRITDRLIEIEIRWSRAHGRPVSAADLVRRFPQAAAAVTEAFSRFQERWVVVLAIETGPQQGAIYDFYDHHSLILGRSASVQWSMKQDPRLSRNHCRIEISPPGLQIVDLGSRNGTFVNGRRIESETLRHNDLIQAGESRIRVRVFAPAVETGLVQSPTVIIAKGAESPAPSRQAAGTSPPSLGGLTQAIPGYELVEEIGHGGLGTVFKARNSSTGDPVAIKFILPTQEVRSDATRLFLREASVLAQLRHPRIVQFHELGIAGTRLYLVMEYVRTTDFDTLMKPLTPERRVQKTAAVICHVLEALHFAHQRGFVHRDVKPANILLSHSAGKLVVKLADFGLAKNFQVAGMSGMTGEGDHRGTVAYMSPEQVVDCRSAKPPSDVYATGVTLFYLLTGRLPFDQATSVPVAFRAILEEIPPRVDSIAPTIPRGLADVVERSLSKKPEERFDSARSMHEALAPFAVTRRRGDRSDGVLPIAE